LELGHLLVDLLVWVIVWSGEDERDRFGAQVGAADEPLIVVLDAEHAGDADQALVIGEDADDVGAPADLAVRALATLKKELTRRRSWPTRRELQTAVFAWIGGWYNRRRLHSTLGYLAPADYENTTPGHDGASLAASRLAPTSEIIKEKAA
jgi:hypothetical protein